MDVADLRRRCPAVRIHHAERATLPGHRLVWNYRSSRRGGGAANAEPCDGAELPGVVLSVDARSLAEIDLKEGNGEYYDRGEHPRNVRLEGGREAMAWVYVVMPARRTPGPEPPTRAYLELLVAAARFWKLPAEHIAEIEATPTRA